MTKRRGRGEGSITKRADGRWHARVDLGWQNGRRVRKHIYGRTRAEVREALAAALRNAAQGLPALDERQTVGQFLRSWLALKQTTLRPRAYASYEQVVRGHLEPGVGKLRLAKLTPQQLSDWFQTHQAAGASARTIRYARTVLRAALNQALRWGMVARNAAALTDPPLYRPREIQPLAPDQARVLLAAVAKHRLRALVSVGLALGLRLGEVLGLPWAAVDLDAGVLSIRQTLERSGGDAAARRRLNAERRELLKGLRDTDDRPRRRELRAALVETRRKLKAVQMTLRFAEPKSARSRRTITLPAVAATALREHRTRQLEERLAAGGRWRDSGLVFTTTIGTPLDPRNVDRQFKAILKAAGLPAIRFHDLRHTAATLLLAQGVDPRTIMETLGHSQISLTLNTYAHVVPALQRMAAAKMDAILGDS